MARVRKEEYGIPVVFRISQEDVDLIGDIMSKKKEFNRSEIIRQLCELGLPIMLESLGLKDNRNKSNGKD